MSCRCIFQHPQSTRVRERLIAQLAVEMELAKSGATAEVRSTAKTRAAVLYVQLYTPCERGAPVDGES